MKKESSSAIPSVTSTSSLPSSTQMSLPNQQLQPSQAPVKSSISNPALTQSSDDIQESFFRAQQMPASVDASSSLFSNDATDWLNESNSFMEYAYPLTSLLLLKLTPSFLVIFTSLATILTPLFKTCPYIRLAHKVYYLK